MPTLLPQDSKLSEQDQWFFFFLPTMAALVLSKETLNKCCCVNYSVAKYPSEENSAKSNISF